VRRALVISLSLVLALAGWSAVCAEDIFVIPVTRGKYAPVPKTGQTTSFAVGDDGDLKKGVASPNLRFTDNKNGTVTDNLTGLIWTKNASAFSPTTWGEAITIANNLHAGSIQGLDDGSQAGDWRLPNIRELQSLVDYGRGGPAFPTPNPFTGVTWENRYWSSTSENASIPDLAWWLGFDLGFAGTDNKSNNTYLVWCVRGGK
jgi:hypothetical protein